MSSIPPFTDADLELSRVAVVAPAGFGKTETIADIVGKAGHRVLVLTHTNAGVAALQRRMAVKGTAANGRVMTIASWCERWASSFPEVSGYAEFVGDKASRDKTGDYYLKIYKAMARLVGHEWVRRSLLSSYSRVIVDEYQDCTESQHSLFLAISSFLPVLVFGDPLQGIFYWTKNDSIVDWGSLSMETRSLRGMPYRWTNCSHEELGKYIFDIRAVLLRTLAGERVTLNLETACRDVTLLPKETLRTWRPQAYGKTVAYITKYPAAQHHFSSTHPGFQSLEPVDCPELLRFSLEFDSNNGSELALTVLNFMRTCFSSISKAISSYSKHLCKGDFNFSRINSSPNTKAALANLENDGSPYAILTLIETMERELKASTRLFRASLLNETKAMLRIASREGINTQDALEKLHSNYAPKGVSAPYRLVSTRAILSKGLEYDYVIVDVASLDDPRDFYVAVSRCREKLVYISDESSITFDPVPPL